METPRVLDTIINGCGNVTHIEREKISSEIAIQGANLEPVIQDNNGA